MSTADGRGRGLAHVAAAPGDGGRRRRVRGRRHVRRGAGAARHDDRRRRADRPAAAGGPDRQRLPARLRRDAPADRPDRRPARPGAGARDGAGALRAGLPHDRGWPTTCRASSPAGSSRESAAAAWCPPPSRWSPTSTPSSAAASRWASCRRCRRSARSWVRSSARPCSPSADWRAIFAINLAVGLVLAAAIRALAPERPRREPGAGGPTSSALLLLLATSRCAAVVFLRARRA